MLSWEGNCKHVLVDRRSVSIRFSLNYYVAFSRDCIRLKVPGLFFYAIKLPDYSHRSLKFFNTDIF